MNFLHIEPREHPYRRRSRQSRLPTDLAAGIFGSTCRSLGLHETLASAQLRFPYGGGAWRSRRKNISNRGASHRDIVRMGMTSVVADTTRMKRDVMPKLIYTTLTEGLDTL